MLQSTSEPTLTCGLEMPLPAEHIVDQCHHRSIIKRRHSPAQLDLGTCRAYGAVSGARTADRSCL